eukprot:CAMPEP_0175883744 /NCGR_PEP_ID=MMETSP0107_2-20121207/44147_1 /TAXON_ID=195067 ORGANISM="Goniomonas pacifica, Strain CCMP1869" /NCGR_SAMPLE_ID=MMETSP0107_2 /ASSEMBLY_ACC=CAM_ASM_000203 /LENGTH=143 /DNA_ID=CAMNT_0017203841 /DNA_START=232 /DNA_END=660 /DNA_ORIENTATION=+
MSDKSQHTNRDSGVEPIVSWSEPGPWTSHVSLTPTGSGALQKRRNSKAQQSLKGRLAGRVHLWRKCRVSPRHRILAENDWAVLKPVVVHCADSVQRHPGSSLQRRTLCLIPCHMDATFVFRPHQLSFWSNVKNVADPNAAGVA